MKNHRCIRIFLLSASLCLLTLLAACGSSSTEPSQQPEPPASEESSDTVTLESLCGADYQTYLLDTITMQMENRMEKNPDIVFFPVQEQKPLTDYVPLDETTDFSLDEDGNIVILFPAGTVTEEAHGEQTFRIPKP
jgi:hypothetical protein